MHLAQGSSRKNALLGGCSLQGATIKKSTFSGVTPASSLLDEPGTRLLPRAPSSDEVPKVPFTPSHCLHLPTSLPTHSLAQLACLPAWLPPATATCLLTGGSGSCRGWVREVEGILQAQPPRQLHGSAGPALVQVLICIPQRFPEQKGFHLWSWTSLFPCCCQPKSGLTESKPG